MLRQILIILMFCSLVVIACDNGTDSELLDQGCDPSRPAVTYAAGENESYMVAPPGGTNAPIPCMSLTNYGAADGNIGITSDGTIVYAPGIGEEGEVGVLYSKDNGITWDLKIPEAAPDGTGHSRMNTYLHVDPVSDNVIFSSDNFVYNLNIFDYSIEDFVDLVEGVVQAIGFKIETGGFHVSTSNDGGNSWTYNRLDDDGLDCPKMFSGPPTVDGPKPVGQNRVSYFMAPSPLDEPIPPVVWPLHQSIYRSLDGGETWSEVSQISLEHPDNDVSVFEWVQYGGGVVDKDGIVYLGYRRGDQLAIATSRDMGETWTFRDVAGMSLVPYYYIVGLADFGFNNYLWNAYISDAIAVDSDGNLYAVAVSEDYVVKMSCSKDKGLTWSTPVVVSAPKRKVFFSSVAVKEPGTLAIAYYGSINEEEWNGYIAETTNAFDANPVFWSVTANDPSDSLFPHDFSTGWFAAIWGTDINEEIHMKYAPNGDIWVAFMKEMCDAVPVSNCRGDWDYYARGKTRYQGAAGRMLHR